MRRGFCKELPVDLIISLCVNKKLKPGGPQSELSSKGTFHDWPWEPMALSAATLHNMGSRTGGVPSTAALAEGPSSCLPAPQNPTAPASPPA